MMPFDDILSEKALEAQTIDPFADLLFTLIAAILPAILLLAPTLERTPSSRPPIDDAKSSIMSSVVLGQSPALTILAGADGLRLHDAGGPAVSLDHVDDDPVLVAALEHARAEHQPLVLLVERDGLESAFLFDPVVAAHGPSDYLLVRVDAECSASRDPAMLTACRGRHGAVRR